MAKAAKKEKVKLPDPVAFSHAMAEAYQKAAPVMQDFYKNYTHQAAAQSIDWSRNWLK